MTAAAADASLGPLVDPERAAQWFGECFQAEPAGVWRAPGRVNLIGEHTDYNQGWVLPFALDRGVVVAAARRDDGVLAIHSRQAPGEPVAVAVAALAPGSVGGWAAYPAGVAWALCEAGHEVGGADLAIDSDLPEGGGLSSSAALECAVALALAGLYGLDIARPELVALTSRAENEMLGIPSGILDQSASLLCEAGHALLLDCQSRDTTLVPLDPAAHGLAMTVIDTRVRHVMADGRYALRRQECERAASGLGVRSLRDLGDHPQVPAGFDEVLARRTRHVVTENQRVHAAVALLRRGDLAGTGELLLASHDSLAGDYEVSWPEADAAVTAACRGGALGARMVGGGFGGSVVALAPADDGHVRAAVEAEFASRGWRTPSFLTAVPSAGASRIR
ncbi:MAG TPA: galactokinase [Streptosporangiaceae bacterium]|nr:galactokinase [Streptosporangiaceae bacterium]